MRAIYIWLHLQIQSLRDWFDYTHTPEWGREYDVKRARFFRFVGKLLIVAFVLWILSRYETSDCGGIRWC